jgi:magnesium-transporting ATPase (P-type)
MPNIFSELQSTEEDIKLETMMNIASTSFIAVCLLLMGTLFLILQNTNLIAQKYFFLFLIVFVGYYMCCINTRGIALVLLLLEFVGLFLANKEPYKNDNKLVYYSLWICMIICTLLIVFIPIISYLIQYIESDRLKDRLDDLLALWSNNGKTDKLSESGSLSARIGLAETSLKTFLSSPVNMLIGIGDHTQSFGGSLRKSGIGNHSEFIDVLARYGIVGVIIFYNILRQYYYNLKKISHDHQINKYLRVIFLIFILYGFLNNVFQPVVQVYVFIILPAIVLTLDKKINDNGTKYSR